SHSPPAPPHLHSFPTRRSSDLLVAQGRHIGALIGMPHGNGYLMLAVNDVPAVEQVGPGATGPAVSNLQSRLLSLGYWLPGVSGVDRKSTRLNSSHVAISYAVFC